MKIGLLWTKLIPLNNKYGGPQPPTSGCALCIGVNALCPVQMQRVLNTNAQNLKQTLRLAAVVHHK